MIIHSLHNASLILFCYSDSGKNLILISSCLSWVTISSSVSYQRAGIQALLLCFNYLSWRSAWLSLTHPLPYICLQVCKAIKSGQYPFVMCNFAPPDMVGHTGKYEPAIKGCEVTGQWFSKCNCAPCSYNWMNSHMGHLLFAKGETFWYKIYNFFLLIDKQIGEIFKTCEENGYVMMVTADHGNAEQMYSEKGGPHTAHTTNRGTSANYLYLPFSCFNLVKLWHSK